MSLREVKLPRLLYITRSYPPVGVVASLRSKNIVKYLSRLGWHITVVTPNPQITKYGNSESPSNSEGCSPDIIYTNHWLKFLLPQFFKSKIGYTLIGKTLRWVFNKFYVDNGVGWILPALFACRKLKKRNVDIIMATGAPFFSFIIAAILSIKLDCPYVLDYRDPWTFGPHHERQFPKLYQRLEQYLIRRSAGVTVVSESMANEIKRFLMLEKHFEVISNGFDPEETELIEASNFGHSAIVYAGRFYPPKRVITPLMRALSIFKKRFMQEDDMPILHYYGPDDKHVSVTAEQFQMNQYIVCHGDVEREEVLSAIKGADLSVVITSVNISADPWDRGVVTGKVFEIMNIGTNILLIAPPDCDVVGIVEGTSSGRSFRGDEIEGMADYIVETCKKSNYSIQNNKVMKYSWFNIAVILDKLLRNWKRPDV